MTRSVRHFRFLLLLPFVLLCMLLPALLQGAVPAADDRARLLADVLGADAASWTVTPPNPAVSLEGKEAGVVGFANTYTTLTSTTRYRGPMEYRFAFRLRPKPNTNAFLTCAVGCTETQSFGYSVVYAPAYGYASCGRSFTPAQGEGGGAYLRPQPFTDRSLAWPEAMRKTLEAQLVSAPKIDDMLLTLRVVVADGKITAFFNERFADQATFSPGIDPSGAIRVQLYDTARLVSVRVMPLKESVPRFEPLGLGGFLNASVLAGGGRVTKLPASAGETARLDQVIFRFPTPDAAGNDHLDLAPSWTRFGALPGFIEAHAGLFGGRWASTERMDPCRFQLLVPTGQYRALHLIAAYDGETDNVPIVTAQFFRPYAGHPVNFAGRVPLYTAKSGGAGAFPVKLSNGKKGRLFHIVIPLEQDQFSWFSDLPNIGLELTKGVKPYRAYPDPLEYSWHAAGLPSGVHIYAATLERAKVEIDPQPDAVGHVWTAPAAPGYTVTLKNNTGAPVTATLAVSAASYDGKDRATEMHTQQVAAGVSTIKVPVHPKRYGLYTLKIACTIDGETQAFTRQLAYLREDTRERGDWADGRGPLFGIFGWGGGHGTPDAVQDLIVYGQAGIETSVHNYGESKDPKVRELAEKYHVICEEAFQGHAMYACAFNPVGDAQLPKLYNAADPEGSGKALIDVLEKIRNAPGPTTKPVYLPFFPEPTIGRFTSCIYPWHYNAGDHPFTIEEEEVYQTRVKMFLTGAKAVRKKWPDVKILLPYGDPMNTAIFLQREPQTRGLIDGIALDLPGFERLPEQQINQVVMNRLYPILQDVRKYQPNPFLVMVEGPVVSSKSIDTSEEEKADIGIRNFLVLLGYGVTRHPSANSSYECAGYWGENHYGGGYCSRKPIAQPEIAYVAYATMTRHLNRANFTGYVPTGSTSVYCQQFKHYRDGHLVHALWTIRGRRPVSVKVAPGETVAVYDENDNPLPLVVRDGSATFTIDQSPCYLEGLAANPTLSLGAPDQSDAVPAKLAARIASPADGSWKLTPVRDEQYEKTNPGQIERFPGAMTAVKEPAPKAQGGRALAVQLGVQEVDRRVMPYYSTLVPKSPVVIPGKASALGLWVKAASDWGRVVYALRDAKGERWISTGTREDWNCDDIHGWSAFAFDGWRYLRFELPASAPYDSYREYGTSWWGSYEGDGIVDLPLRLEKIIVERRSSVIYGNSLVPAKPDDVLLGDLLAEYETVEDRTAEAVRLSRLRMPVPAGLPELDNPIATLEKTGAGIPVQLLRVSDPAHMYDGTRCHVFFTIVEGAKGYDVWASPYADGRGALKLGSGWTESGQLLEGLAPNTDFYLFVVYTDRDGKLSKPSAPLKIQLKNGFVYQ